MKFRAKINGEWTDWVDKETLRKMNISAFTWVQGEGSQESNTAGNTPALADFWKSPTPTPSKAQSKSKRWIWFIFLAFFFLIFVLALWQSAQSDSPITREDKIEFYKKTLEQVDASYYGENFEEAKKSIILAQSLEKDLELPTAVELDLLRENAVQQGDELVALDAPEQALLHFEIAQTIQNDRDIRRKIRKAKASIP